MIEQIGRVVLVVKAGIMELGTFVAEVLTGPPSNVSEATSQHED